MDKRIIPPDVIIEESQPEHAIIPPDTSFWSEVTFSVFFIIEPANLGALAVVWFFNLLLVAAFQFGAFMLWPLSLFAAPATLLLSGCLFAYYMRIIQEAAGGDEQLPSTAGPGGAYENVLRPMFVFLATWLCLLIPALAIAIFRSAWNLNIPDAFITAVVFAGMFMWPMAVLCVSIGGITVFARADLMIASVFRTLGPYLFVWFVLMATLVGGGLVWEFIDKRPGPASPSFLAQHPVTGLVVSSLILSYGSILTMRVIGLYYRHFRHRFAWSWG
jgi:hypothetical protein